MPADLDLAQGYTLRFTALDPITGALVANVKVSNAVITAVPLTGGDLSSGSFTYGPYMLVPGPAA
jgi:hypothetical protein